MVTTGLCTMAIDAGFVIWFVMCCAMLVMLAAAVWDRGDQPRRTRVVAHIQPAPAEPAVAPQDEETRRWVAAGLRKLGYTAPEAARVAATTPPGATLETGLHYCLRNRGKL